MKNFNYLIFYIAVFLTSCSSSNKKQEKDYNISFLHINDSGIEINIDTLEYFYSKKYTDKSYIYEYKNLNDYFTVEIDFENLEGFYINLDKKIPLLYDYQRKYFFNNKEEIIYKFNAFSGAMDGDFYLFVSPKYGAILKRSTTWPILTELTTHFQSNDFKLLLSFIYNDLFKEQDKPAPPISPY